MTLETVLSYLLMVSTTIGTIAVIMLYRIDRKYWQQKEKELL